jgi:hypothetical protein
MLSRQQMIDVITGGGAVHYRGRIITKEVNLPSAIELARTPEEKDAAKSVLTANIAEQQKLLESLDAPQTLGESNDKGTATNKKK